MFRRANASIRIYENTSLGDLYLLEMDGVKMGILGQPDESMKELYRTKVKYGDGVIADTVLVLQRREDDLG